LSKINALLSEEMANKLLLVWLLTLPFGANVLPISIGFMTIYPNLIVSLLLLPYAFKTFKSWGKVHKIAVGFFFVWLIQAVIHLFYIDGKAEAIFDIRSLTLQFFVITILISLFFQLGKDKFFETLIFGVRYILILLLLFGLFEALSGIHFEGGYTFNCLKIAPSIVHYAPMFVYKNPNDFIAYITGITVILLFIDKEFSANKSLLFLVLFVEYYFSFLADSRIAEFFILTLIFIFSIRLIFDMFKRKKLSLIFMFFSLFFIGLMFYTKPITLGPKVTTYINESKKAKLNNQEKKIQKEMINSDNIRRNLIYRGFEMFKESPFIGIGPGQFRYILSNSKELHLFGTNSNPHSYVIEILSQYGLIAALYILGFCFLFFRLLFHHAKIIDKKLPLLIALPAFLLISTMPSSFLYLDINWLFVGLFLITTFDELKFK
jgi:teichuronic acid biosynthesis protein TuaE